MKNKPRYFIFENVKGLLSDDSGRTFKRWLDYLGKSINGNPIIFPLEQCANYHIYYKVLNSKDFGVPQNRERVFIIGIRDDEDNYFRFPKEEHLKLKLKDVLEDEVDGKYYLSQKMINYISKDREGNEKLIVNRNVANTITCEIKKMQRSCQDNYIEWIADYRNDEGLRIRKDNISPCVNSHLKGGEFNNKRGQQDLLIGNLNKIRRLTPRECFRLQDFPETFKWTCSDSQAYKQAGNSITVGVLAKIIEKLNL
tara:strand:+ start:6 stop:767 length:762 start_codon:yes stop_codon:yes gene_type:complete